MATDPAPWCGRPLPDDRDGWRTRALAFLEIIKEKETEVERLKDELAFQSKNAADAHAERAHQFRRAADALEENQRLRRALSDIQFDLINCHEAASRNACEHIQDAISIVNRALQEVPDKT